MSVDIVDRDGRISRENFNRKDLMTIFAAAQSAQANSFARKTAQEWLRIYPGDLEVNLLLCKALLGERRTEQAYALLEKICLLDPQYVAAWQLSAEVSQPGSQMQLIAHSCLHALEQPAAHATQLLPWSDALCMAEGSIQDNDWPAAEELIYWVLDKYPDVALGAIVHLHLLEALQDPTGVFSFARMYHIRWPQCISFTLQMVQGLFGARDDTSAMQLLQQCVAQDPAGQVVSRLWGSEHAFRPLWPERMGIEFDLAVPADVARVLGWNQLNHPDVPLQGVLPETAIPEEPGLVHSLPAAQTKPLSPGLPAVQAVGHEKKPPQIIRPPRRRSNDPEVREIENSFQKLAEKYHDPRLAQTDGRFPVYVIFSTRSGLEKKFGAQNCQIVEGEMQQLAATIARYPEWGSLIFMPDDAASAGAHGLAAVKEIDPWTLKLALTDLDQVLARKGSMIGALLIVGGAEVVPFHHLPNPTDDVDDDVPSDNPYATLDGNYFVPEWPVGRLPDEKGSDPALLLAQLRKITAAHQNKMSGSKSVSKKSLLVQWITFLLSLFLKQTPENGSQHDGFGYSAAVWRRSSIAAFRPIGSAQDLEISPPEPAEKFKYERIMGAGLGYFNLHGVADAPEWYGQRDITEPYVGPDYPVALRPANLVKNGHAPRVVFTEACYGGHVFQKKELESVALRFLSAGTSAVVASTCIAYGSVSMPLIGADLLGNLFWQYLQDGAPAGEALLRAKIDLVKQMEKRQGFMDGEDQKTMISFVLYGDPLARANSQQATAKSIARLRTPIDVRMVCDIKEKDLHDYQEGVVAEVKQLVEVYLPGLDQAEFSFSQEYQIDSEYLQPKNWSGGTASKVRATGQAGRTVITVSKLVHGTANIHHHYARVTLDKNGKLVKLALSR